MREERSVIKRWGDKKKGDNEKYITDNEKNIERHEKWIILMPLGGKMMRNAIFRIYFSLPMPLAICCLSQKDENMRNDSLKSFLVALSRLLYIGSIGSRLKLKLILW